MKNTTWDSYQLFLDVARGGGLTGAVASSGLSPATIGRRMLELEGQVGRPLFERSQAGYTLTGNGQALFDQLLEMEAAARKVDSWQRDAQGASIVRIAAGTWVGWLLSQNMPTICSERDGFGIDLHLGERRASLAHRESDIGIRAFEPEETNLAAIKTGDVAYAAYQARNMRFSGPQRWIAVAEEEAISAYLRWPHQNKREEIVFTVSRPRSLHDLVLAGSGIAVLPCFVGDQEPRLARVGEEIPELRHRQWIVMNNADRHRREIRTVVDRMTKLLKSHAELFAGKRPTYL
ncbi:MULTISPECIES: LysR family transcriptional regulator [unclassified Rhizobium]|uniref:LysR family transcriptional regulator n=1 Tax=Rhizobium TaxID=379 RepID=UPI00084C711D|nr:MULTISPECIES: LysR family transcriptional regulator [unclassified Rhizobium]OEC98560.1 LysR family transcriptional regulator [Rhizobium sp. YK2]QYA12813.1 LysR family transcriptional regulator [Rhizobium sp. AB2/73]UEQ81254.1 LysR family transcriptional regulator [Rhizobium sp. AB2/73]